MNSNSAKRDPWPKIIDLLNGCNACGSAGTRPVLTRESTTATESGIPPCLRYEVAQSRLVGYAIFLGLRND
jgi:hypothetical protein